MVGFGLAAPLAGQLLAGAAQAQTRPAFTPTKRGGGGQLKVLSWDAPVLLNPQIAVGLKDWN
ncbi:MAG TPA: peptide ABC transporter substrate-binding protein, partial [Candidatus Eisenbacteria bacterium]|nr:peptide ABC transporter substrate-binding protein [Candidatus Eisenbacteria bacterium]